mmetsp:Transcript_72916/g.126626  ORF Transcript_72916/g.126626 Transcript_72916/m.126626 type:complete len:455 (-) Transcript_72916:98-1462(-)
MPFFHMQRLAACCLGVAVQAAQLSFKLGGHKVGNQTKRTDIGTEVMEMAKVHSGTLVELFPGRGSGVVTIANVANVDLGTHAKFPPGLLFGIACLVITLAFEAFTWYLDTCTEDESEQESPDPESLPVPPVRRRSSRRSSGVGSMIAPPHVQEHSSTSGRRSSVKMLMRQVTTLNFNTLDTRKLKEKFASLAEANELDFYSCTALAIGRHKTSKKNMKLLPGLICTICMQFLLGLLLLEVTIEDSSFRYYPIESSWEFRLAGCFLFLWGSWQLMTAFDDECRDVLIQCMKQKHVSAWYKLPILLGEVLNKCIGLTLLVILYTIFCQTKRPTSLLMNAIAVNFVAEIDTYLVTQDLCQQAEDDFDAALDEWEQEDDYDGGMLQKAVLFVCTTICTVYPFITTVFVMLLVFANDRSLCNDMQNWDPWPFCLGIDPEVQSIYEKAGIWLTPHWLRSH